MHHRPQSPASGSSPDVPARKMSRSNSGKIPRGRMACLQCRSRRSKCSACRPDPCQRCIEEGLTCTWPAMDGRSTRAKKKAKPELAERKVDPFDRLDGLHPGAINGVSDSHAAPPALSRTNGDVHWPVNAFGDSRMTDTSALRLEADPFAGLQVTSSSEAVLPSFPGPSDMFDGSWANFPDSFFPSAGEGSGTSASVGLQQSLLDPQLYPAGMPSTVDPQQLIWAFSSRLPFVEESSQGDSTSPNKGPPKNGRPQDGQIFKITWWRPHGKTAIAPGLKRITLKVRIDRAAPLHTFSPSSDPFSVTPDSNELFLPDGMPIHPIMRHLLELFSVHFSSQFPYLQASSLKDQLDSGTGSVFLFNCIASAAARFSTHPSIALPNVEPHAYGNVFGNRAKALLGSMLGVPCRDTVAGFLLLALTGAGNDSESEVWMMIGIAVRMSIDIGLHVDCSTSAISDEERRLNRLLFWSVLMLDHALSFGVGRPTSFPQQNITQILPTQEDLNAEASSPRSAFVSAARMFLLFTPLINTMNEPDGNDSSARQQAIVSTIINEYSQLPEDMAWNVKNLQVHDRVHQAPIFLWLHLWTHTVLVSQSLMEPNKVEPESSLPAATPTRAATASAVWSNSARTIGEILVLSDIVNPFAYIPLELANQCFYVAACYYVREIELLGASDGPNDSNSKKRPWSHEPLANSSQISLERSRQSDLSRALLVSVAKESVLTLQQGLDKQTRYWSSIQWIAQSLAQRLEGIARTDLDLADITAKMKTTVSLPDAGLVDREANKSKI